MAGKELKFAVKVMVIIKKRTYKQKEFWNDRSHLRDSKSHVVQVAWWWWCGWWRGRCCWWSIGSSESSSSMSHDMSLSSSSSSPMLCPSIISCCCCWWWWLLPLAPPPDEEPDPLPPTPLLPPLDLCFCLPSGGGSSGPSSPSCWTLLCFVLRFWNQTLTFKSQKRNEIQLKRWVLVWTQSVRCVLLIDWTRADDLEIA